MSGENRQTAPDSPAGREAQRGEVSVRQETDGRSRPVTPRWRRESKYVLNLEDYHYLRVRLRQLAEPDSNTNADGVYTVRSVYFDDYADSVLTEKLDGTDRRVKYRTRLYNGDFRFIRLERKIRQNGLGRKDTQPLTEELTRNFLENRLVLPDTRRSGVDQERHFSLLEELSYEMLTRGLRPKILVSYTREPYVYSPGNVRVTFDYNLRRSGNPCDFLLENPPLLPVADAPFLMEVKWDFCLPTVIQSLLGPVGRPAAAFSKYAYCRLNG